MPMAMIQSGLRRSLGGGAAASSFAAEGDSAGTTAVGRPVELDGGLGLDGWDSAGSVFIASVSAGARRALLPPLFETAWRERLAPGFRSVHGVFQP
jgi:hypothetical protein